MWQTILNIDKAWLLALNGDGGAFWDSFFYIASARLTWVPLYLLLLYFIWHKWGWKGILWTLLTLGVAVVAADQICNFFKHFTPKLRPTHTPDIAAWVHTVRGYRGGPYGTVSAHAAISFCIALFTSRLFKRPWLTIVLFGWALLVAYSRIYLGVHFPMDIMFGTMLGLFMGEAAFRLFRRQVSKPLNQTSES